MEKSIEEFKIYFKENNSNGVKCREKNIKNKFPIFYNNLKDFQSNLEIENFNEILFLFLNNLKNKPKCDCGKELKFGKSINEGYSKYCSLSCTNKSKEHIENVKITNNLKYGGNSPISSNIIKNKIKETMLNKHGVENIFENVEYIQNKVLEKYGNKHITKSKHYKNLIENSYMKKYPHIIKNGRDIEYKCEKCNNISIYQSNNFRYRNLNNINLCLTCLPMSQSYIEKELEEFLIDNNILFEKHNRNIIKPKEIDFLCGDIGIELHGNYWHSEIFRDNNYHYDKWLNCKNKNIKLIQIFEDEWKYKKEIIKSILLNNLKKENNIIYARKTEVRLISNKIYTDFCFDNHIQGYGIAKIRLGLFFNNELIQIMSFSSNRINLGNKNIENEYEMIRLCTKIGNIIIGGSSKLLKFFEDNFKPKKIITYCDLRFFNGKIYEKLDFKFEKLTKPNYFYLKSNDLTRYNRFNFRKDKLIKLGYDKNLTEFQIMKDNGYLKIYDVGNMKFSKIYNY